MENMKKRTVAKKFKFITPNDVKKFTWVTSKCKGEVECVEMNRNVSGKSILGMFSLDLTHPVIVQFHDVYGNEEWFKELKEWEVE